MDKKLLLTAAVLVALLVVGLIVYPKLSAGYTPDTPPASQDGGADTQATPAPDFTVTARDGSAVSLSDFAGKPVLVNFWATWCSPCRTELPDFEDAYKTYGEDVVFLMVNVGAPRDTAESAWAFADENGYTFPVYFDTNNDGASAYGVRSIPMTVLVGADGEWLESHVGMLDSKALQSYMDILLGGEEE